MDQNKAEIPKHRLLNVLLRRKVDENYFYFIRMAVIGM